MSDDAIRQLLTPLREQSLQPLRHLVRKDPSRRGAVRRLGGLEAISVAAGSCEATLSTRCEFLFTLAVCSDVDAKYVLSSREVARTLVLSTLKECADAPESLETTLFAIALFCLNCPAFRFTLHDSGVTAYLLGVLREVDGRALDVQNTCNALTAVKALCESNESAGRDVMASGIMVRVSPYLSQEATRGAAASLVTTLATYESPHAASAAAFLDEGAVCVLCAHATNLSSTDDTACCTALFAVLRRWPRFQAVLAHNVATTAVARALCSGAAHLYAWKKRQGRGITDPLVSHATLPLPHFDNATLLVWEVERASWDTYGGLSLVPMSSRLPNGTWHVCLGAYSDESDDDTSFAENDPRMGLTITDAIQTHIHTAAAPRGFVPFDVPVSTNMHPLGVSPRVADPANFWGGVVVVWVPGAVTVATVAKPPVAPVESLLLSAVKAQRRSNTPPARFSQKPRSTTTSPPPTPAESAVRSLLQSGGSPYTPRSVVPFLKTVSPPPVAPPPVTPTSEKDSSLECEKLRDQNAALTTELLASRQATEAAKRELAIAKHRLSNARGLVSRMEKEAAATEADVGHYVKHIALLQQKLVQAGMHSEI